MTNKELRYDQRVSAQIAQYANVENMNVMSDAWHYWQTEYFLPRYRQVMGVPTPFHLYLETFAEAIRKTGVSQLLSVGFGDGVIEARLIKELRERGLADCRMDAVEISAAQIERGRNNAEKAGVLDAFNFIESDTNKWKPEKQYAGVMVHQALHHIQELESFFSSVKAALLTGGRFVTFDVVGRNGHMRWPETLEIVQSLWKMLPLEKRRHHILKCVDVEYVNRDCSTQGFEGIRAQDILPLLVKEFAFEKFLAWGGLTDVFVSRGFGPNFDMNDERDRAFIDHVALLNDVLIDAGRIKPTVIAAVMHVGPQGDCAQYRHWSPQFAVRSVGGDLTAPSAAVSEVASPGSLATDSGPTTILHADLQLDETQRRYLPHIGEILHHETSVDAKVLETSDWYYGLLKGVIERNKRNFASRGPRYLELACYRHIIGYRLAKEYGFKATHFDICERDLLEGRAVALANGYPDEVELVAGDYHSLPFADGSFDLVFISAAIHHSRVPEHIIGEAMRVLRKGGLFYCQREPAKRAFCFYRFVGNRPHSHTAFERHLWDSGLIRILSSPFPGARNSLLFGRIENDQIELDDYYRAFERWGSLREEVVYHEGLLTPLDKEILEKAKAGKDSVASFISERLKVEFSKAAALLTERDRLLGYSVPDDGEVEAMAARTAESLAALPADTTSAEWKRGMGRLFGASLRFVVERGGEARPKPESHLARGLVQRSGIVSTDPELQQKSGLDFSRRILPSLQDSAEYDWTRIFPEDDWKHIETREQSAQGGLVYRRRIVAKVSAPRIELALTEPALLVLRSRCVLPANEWSARVILSDASGRALCRNFFPQTEDQAMLAKLPAGNQTLTLRTEGTADSLTTEARVEVSVCQLLG